MGGEPATETILRVLSQGEFMSIEIALALNGNENQSWGNDDLKTNPPRPIMTPREARRVLGGDYKNLSDDALYRVIIEMERLAALLANNPEIFNLSKGE